MSNPVMCEFHLGTSIKKKVILMPENTEVVSVGVKNSELFIWAICTPNGKLRTRCFRIIENGGQPTHGGLADFIGTVQIEGIVWHVFQQWSLKELVRDESSITIR